MRCDISTYKIPIIQLCETALDGFKAETKIKKLKMLKIQCNTNNVESKIILPLYRKKVQ